jgi:AraC-like DNA-binding protein
VAEVCGVSPRYLCDLLKSYNTSVSELLWKSRVQRARDLLLAAERQKFLAEEWPRVSATIQRLGLTPEELLEAGEKD